MNIRRLRPEEVDTQSLLASGEPAILTGEALDWPACSRWTWGELRRRCAGLPIPVRFGDELRWWTVGPLVDAILAGEDVYGVDWEFERDCPDLADDLDTSMLGFDDCFARLPADIRPRLRWLYLGAPGTGSPLHQDVLCTNAWLALLRGRKRWVLYPPETFRPGEVRDHDAFAEGSAERDRRAGRLRLEATVRAGDVIFVPSCWWHQVLNLEPSIALTANFCHPTIRHAVRREAAGGRFAYLVPRLEALRW